MDFETRVLVVGESPHVAQRWREWLEQAGFAVLSCAGPRLAWECPRLIGERCPRRELADVAVVAVTAGDERLCTRLPDDETTVFVEAADGGPGIGPDWVALPLPRPEAPGALIEAVREAARRNLTAPSLR